MTTATAAKARSMAKALGPAVNAYLLARVFAEAEREKMNAVDRELFAAWDIRYGPLAGDREGQRITDPKHGYLMADEYAEDYRQDRNRKVRAMGYDLPEDHCPALCAESIVREANRVLLDHAAEFVPGIEWGHCAMHPGSVEKATDLIVRLVVNAPGYVAPKIGGAA